MSAERGKLYQDRLYGTKVLSPLAVEAMNTAEFQRLAGLRQLGFTDLVFRGATHTRFEHSVGTYFICRTMMRRIVQNHDRLRLGHPGQYVNECFALTPDDWLPDGTAKGIREKSISPSYQARWRGLTEVISVAGLLHDLGHVPFGHTLEDEFTGIYGRHDRLAGPRLHEILFDKSSELAHVFSGEMNPWLPGISNDQLRALIYVILNWKEKIEHPVQSFTTLLDKAIQGNNKDPKQKDRLLSLKGLYVDFKNQDMFHPFMSDIVGNTICADLLDYLPRDRTNLGMESRRHERLLRYFTIRKGTLYEPEEGLRLSIMVTRKGRGGQRRDVATTVLDIMRERYQMPERVFYHHKKAAASAMLAKLTELAGHVGAKPRGEDGIYPAPWNEARSTESLVPHMVHLSDSDLLGYLGNVKVDDTSAMLQRRLYQALKYRRKGLYRTLLVVDSDLAHESPGTIGSFARYFRENDGKDRIALEADLAKAAGAENGDVLIYCPDPHMQSKEVDARMEIQEGRILPLRLQRESFAYSDDLKVLQQYYTELWCAYIFVSPSLYDNEDKCRLVVDCICGKLNMPKEIAYKKVRGFNFHMSPEQASTRALEIAGTFLRDLPFEDLSREVTGTFMKEASIDAKFIDNLSDRPGSRRRLSELFEVATIRVNEKQAKDDEASAKAQNVCSDLLSGARVPLLVSNEDLSFSSYRTSVLNSFGAAHSGELSGVDSKEPTTEQPIFSKTRIRETLIAFGQRFKQPNAADEWNTNLDPVVDYLAGLTPKATNDKMKLIDRATLEQSSILSARFTPDQLMDLISSDSKKETSRDRLFEE
jgi:HD superfamily phosphohydrolase